MTKLIIFDIDGTLTDTNEPSSSCFFQAVSANLNLDGLNINRHEYKHSTDSG